MNVSIVIGCHGSIEWADLAWSRAYPSTLNQGEGIETVVSYDKHGTVSSARNKGAAETSGTWLLFLDADDELASGYVDAMMREATHSALLLTPQVQYVAGAAVADPKFWQECDLRDGNWMVIGTMISREMFNRVGGFKDWPIYEDWCLWQRATLAGAVPHRVPGAVYVAHVTASSRNRSPRHDERTEVHHAIRRANYPDLY